MNARNFPCKRNIVRNFIYGLLNKLFYGQHNDSYYIFMSHFLFYSHAAKLFSNKIETILTHIFSIFFLVIAFALFYFILFVLFFFSMFA